ncbi:MAG TPA: hypothetical protein PLY73_15960, partial [Candidatus Ozemobacteraceae bacterium]|nr:hypothetical protein [Candidatus Ozemobacteraceae bacterium]
MTHSSHKRSIHAFFLLFLATGALVRAEDAPPGTPNHQHPASMTIPMEAVETGHGAFVAIPPELTLEDCLKLAAGNNRTVLASRARTSAGRAKANQVFRTQLPNASVSAQDTKYREPTSPTLSD